jgi:signal transduction histidine kinase
MSSQLVTISIADPAQGHAPLASWSSREQGALAHAFAGFASAAVALERSYTQLQSEVERLRRELEGRNRDLAQSLEENRSMRQYLDRLVEGLPCGVLVIEGDARIALSNPEARRLLGALSGRAAQDLEPALPWLREWIRDTLGETSEHEYRCPDRRVMSRPVGGIPEKQRERERVKEREKETEVEWIAARPALLGTGLNSVLILRDITAARRLEQEQEQMRCRHALAEMSAVLAHEIRNPLGSLELFAGLLAEAALGPEPRQWVAHLQAGLRLLGATVNNVLHFHRPLAPGLVPTDLGTLLAWLEEFLRPLAQQAQVALELHHHLAGVEVAADRHRLEQVLLNLALNALRFMPHGGRLKISGRVRGSGQRLKVKLEVVDTGCGITAENLQRIFAPGFTTRAGSPGLGLAVCRTIMQQHGGKITVSSCPGRGSRFALEFPLLSVTADRASRPGDRSQAMGVGA